MTEAIEIRMPAEHQEGTESVVAGWLKRVGDQVIEHEPIVEINTDKVSMEISSPASGVLIEIVKQIDQKINPGDLLGIVQLGEVAAPRPVTKSSNTRSLPEESSTSREKLAELSPAVRRLLKEKGIRAEDVTGSGSQGRILLEDVERYVSNSQPADPSARRVPHTQMRKSIAAHMVQSLLKTAPHVTTVFECDLSNVIAHRASHKDGFADKGVKLTYTPYFIQAAVVALKTVPEINSKWHDDSLEMFESCHIGVAIGLESGGLIVPVIKDAQNKSLFEVASALQELSQRARTQTLAPKDVQGGTFTISNHGMTGSLIATPIIINQPQSAILGIGKLEKRVVVEEVNGIDQMLIKPMMYVSLSIDHRVTDGLQANAFLQKFVDELESFS